MCSRLRFHHIFLLSVFIIVFAGIEGRAPAAEGTPEAVKDESLSSIWTARANDIDALIQDVTGLQKSAESMAGTLAKDLRSLRSDFTRLSSLYQASRGHPTEQLTLVQQMRTLRQQMKKRIAPLEEIAATISTRLEEIALLQKNIADITQDSAKAGINMPSEEDDTGLKRYKRSLDEAKRILTPASFRLQNILAPAHSIMTQIEQSITDIESSLVSIWESYYVTPSDTSLEALTLSPALLRDWAFSLNSRIAFAYPQSKNEWFSAFKLFLPSLACAAFLGYFALKGARRFSGRWRVSLEKAITRSWLWIGLGFAILASSPNRFGGIYFGFVLAGSLMVIAGVATLSWRLRIAVVPVLEDKPSPLNRLYPPAAVGMLMLFSDLPTRILGVAWALVIALFLLRLGAMTRKHKNESALPLLERLSYGCALWFGLGSLLVTLGGYARLAILVFMLLFALINTVTLGNALMGLSEILTDRLFSKKNMPVLYAVSEAAAIPLAWILSLLCTLPWFWAIPGARYVAKQVLSTNYTLGEASFDFSRLLFIALLFFLFRSIISLCNTSLDHLPNRMPSLERGVIPPLRSLTSYALWALFAVIALGMVGVNFTNLAVVAGGLSVGIGFGMQNIFNNLVSGLLLIFGRTILVGDYVNVAGASGTVRAINIRSTLIETPERALVYVPNSAIMSGQVTNWTRNNRMVRQTLSIGVAYGSDTAQVTSLLLQAAEEQQNILQKPPPMVYLTNFSGSSLDFNMNVFIDDFDNSSRTMSNLRITVERLFSENDINIPPPQTPAPGK